MSMSIRNKNLSKFWSDQGCIEDNVITFPKNHDFMTHSFRVRNNDYVSRETLINAQWLIETFDTFYWTNYDKWKAIIVNHDKVKMCSY